MIPLFALMALLPISSKVVVHGGTTCPWSELVTAELSVAAAAESRSPYHASITEADDEVRVELYRDDGHLVAARALRATKDCGIRARAVAVMIATWLGGEPDVTRTQDVPVEPETSAPEASTDVETKRTDRVPAAAASPPRSDWGVAASVTPLASLAQGGAVPGLAVGGALSWGSIWGVRAGLWSTRPYSLVLTNGSVKWRRTALSLEPTIGVRSGMFRLVFGAGVAAALVDVEGAGLSVNAHPAAATLGVCESVSAGLDLGTVAVSLTIAGSAWLGKDEVVVTNTVEGTLSPLELQLGLELEWEIRRVLPLGG
jgi:hypothetical protein